MLKKSEVEMERARLIKITRHLIRLKASLAADIEINNTLPDRISEFDAALQSGELKTAYPLLEDVLES